MSSQVVQLGIGLVTAELVALEGLELELFVGVLDMDRQRLALREGLDAALNDAAERLELDHWSVSSTLMRLEVVELSVGLGAAGDRALKDTSGDSLAGSSVSTGSVHDGGGRVRVFFLVLEHVELGRLRLSHLIELLKGRGQIREARVHRS